MTDLAQLLQQSSTHAWLFAPSAILLGALHGLEPGHSKTMMAAFIIAIRGTVPQAVLLGLSAAASHTAIVWVVALAGLHFGQQWSGGHNEAYLQVASAVVIVGIAAWMVWRTWREQNLDHDHDHHHDHAHGHPQQVELDGNLLSFEIFEDGVPPRWRIRSENAAVPAVAEVAVTTIRSDGSRQVFRFVGERDYLESVDEIPEPHAFKAHVAVGGNAAELVFEEHDHAHMDLGEEDDAHARAHAADIRKRFAGRTVTTAQIVLFGLTGGLIPCPAAITVLLLCIQLKQFSLGFALVLCFGIGLAATMVSAGVVAALGIRHVERHWSGFTRFAHRAPYVSAALIVCVGFYTGWIGWHEIVS